MTVIKIPLTVNTVKRWLPQLVVTATPGAVAVAASSPQLAEIKF